MRTSTRQVRLLLSLLVVSASVLDQALADQSVYFADVRLEHAIRRHLGVSGPLGQGDILKLEAISIEGGKSLDLTGLDAATNLQVLRIYGGTIRDTSALAGMKGLRELALHGCGIENISWIGDLSSLRHLSLESNRIADLAPLTRLANLQIVDLSGNRVPSLAPMKAMRGLIRLDVRNNPLRAEEVAEYQESLRGAGWTGRLLHGEKGAVNVAHSDFLAAKAKLADYTSNMQFDYYDWSTCPQFPPLPDDVRTAMITLDRAQDIDYLTDLAAVWMAFAREVIGKHNRAGIVVDPAQLPFCQKLVDAVKPDLPGDEISSSGLARWISAHRAEFGPSFLLDRRIEEFQATDKRNLHDVLTGR